MTEIILKTVYKYGISFHQEGKSNVPNFDCGVESIDARLFDGDDIIVARLLDEEGNSKVRALDWGVLGL